MNPTLRSWTAAVLFMAFGLSSTAGQAPDWWTTRGVLKAGAQADDYAVINQGQLKHLAHQAFLEMEAKLPGGAGPTITSLVTPWLTPGPNADAYAVVTVGQLKRVAQPFHQRLIDLQLATDYPWTESPSDDDNYALANIGMAKRLFAFTVPEPPPPLVMTALYYQQEMNAGYDAPYGVIAALSQGGEPVNGIEVTFEVVESEGSLFEHVGGALQSTVTKVSSGFGRAECGFRAPAEPAYCWVKASAQGLEPQWYLMIVGGGGPGEFPSHPPGVTGVSFAQDDDGDGVTTAVELRLGSNAKDADDNPAEHATGTESPFKITFHEWKAGKIEPDMRGWQIQQDSQVISAEIEEHGWNWPQGSTFPPEDWATNSYAATIPDGMSAAAWVLLHSEPRPPYVRRTYRIETFTDTTYEPPRFEGRVWETVSHIGGEVANVDYDEVMVASHVDPFWFANVIVPQYQTHYWTVPTGGTWQLARVTTHTTPPPEPTIYTGDPTHKYENQAHGPESSAEPGWSAAPSYTDSPIPKLTERGGVIAFEPLYLPANGGELATAESTLNMEEAREYEDANHETRTVDVYTGAYQSGKVNIEWRDDWPFVMTEAAKKEWISRFLVVRETTVPGPFGTPVPTTTALSLSEFIAADSNGGTLATVDPGVPQVGLTKKVEVSLVAIQIAQHHATVVSGVGHPPRTVNPLRFCRWLDAHPNGVRDNQFADKDRDRFQIRIPATIPGLTKMKIKAIDLHGAVIGGTFQSKTSDGDYEVDMKEVSGAMVSESILLVSDGDDDVTFNGKGVNDGKNDQTLLADFGSKIAVSFPEMEGVSATFKVQNPIGTVTLDMVYCAPTNGANPVIMPADMIPLMELQVHKAREIYRQVGIKIDGFTIGLIVFPSAWLQYTSPNDPSGNLSEVETISLTALIESRLLPSKRIRVGFVDALMLSDAQGNYQSGRVKQVGLDPCLVSIDLFARTFLNTLAHEVGHVSKLQHNYTYEPNMNHWLMRQRANMYWFNNSNAAKRFMKGDAEAIKKESNYYVPFK